MSAAVPVFLALACVAFIGGSLYRILPDVDVARLRRDLNRLVLMVLLPALNFHVIYSAKLGRQIWMVPTAAAGALFAIVILSIAIFWSVKDGRVKAALVLVCACSNVTYMGLPVVRGLFPEAVQQVTEAVVLYEMTITPINLALGGWLAARYVSRSAMPGGAVLRQVAMMPLIWAIAAGLLLNLAQVPVPAFVLQATSILGQALSGLMMLSLGMALRPEMLRDVRRLLPLAAPAIVLKLLVSPALVHLVATSLALPAPYGVATTVLGAMPTQLIVLVTADRYNLDVESVAPIIFVDTILSFVTVPAIFAWLQ